MHPTEQLNSDQARGQMRHTNTALLAGEAGTCSLPMALELFLQVLRTHLRHLVNQEDR